MLVAGSVPAARELLSRLLGPPASTEAEEERESFEAKLLRNMRELLVFRELEPGEEPMPGEILLED